MGSIQTVKEKYSYPDGLRMDVSLDDGVTHDDAGVLADGISWTFNYDLTDVENGNAADPDPQAKNMSVAIAPSALRSWDQTVMQKLSAGLMSLESTAGVLVPGATDTLVSSTWSKNVVYVLDGQDGDGTAQVINSVTGGTDGAYALGTDYEIVQAAGGWGISLFGAGVTTTAQDVVIDYDYTPSASTTLYAGASSVILDPYQVRLRHYLDETFTTYDYEVIFYRVTPDAGAIVLTKSGALSGNDLDEWTIALTADIESGNVSGKQLFAITETPVV